MLAAGWTLIGTVHAMELKTNMGKDCPHRFMIIFSSNGKTSSQCFIWIFCLLGLDSSHVCTHKSIQSNLNFPFGNQASITRLTPNWVPKFQGNLQPNTKQSMNCMTIMFFKVQRLQVRWKWLLTFSNWSWYYFTATLNTNSLFSLQYSPIHKYHMWTTLKIQIARKETIRKKDTSGLADHL